MSNIDETFEVAGPETEAGKEAEAEAAEPESEGIRIHRQCIQESKARLEEHIEKYGPIDGPLLAMKEERRIQEQRDLEYLLQHTFDKRIDLITIEDIEKEIDVKAQEFRIEQSNHNAILSKISYIQSINSALIKGLEQKKLEKERFDFQRAMYREKARWDLPIDESIIKSCKTYPNFVNCEYNRRMSCKPLTWCPQGRGTPYWESHYGGCCDACFWNQSGPENPSLQSKICWQCHYAANEECNVCEELQEDCKKCHSHPVFGQPYWDRKKNPKLCKGCVHRTKGNLKPGTIGMYTAYVDDDLDKIVNFLEKRYIRVSTRKRGDICKIKIIYKTFEAMENKISRN